MKTFYLFRSKTKVNNQRKNIEKIEDWVVSMQRRILQNSYKNNLGECIPLHQKSTKFWSNRRPMLLLLHVFAVKKCKQKQGKMRENLNIARKWVFVERSRIPKQTKKWEEKNSGTDAEECSDVRKWQDTENDKKKEKINWKANKQALLEQKHIQTKPTLNTHTLSEYKTYETHFNDKHTHDAKTENW